MSAEEHCEVLVDDEGRPVASVRVSGELTDEGRKHMLAIVEAAQHHFAEQDAADPEAAEERARRQAASIARIRERARRRRGDAE